MVSLSSLKVKLPLTVNTMLDMNSIYITHQLFATECELDTTFAAPLLKQIPNECDPDPDPATIRRLQQGLGCSGTASP